MGARGPSRQSLELDLLRGGRGKRPAVAPQPVEDNPSLGCDLLGVLIALLQLLA